MSAIVASLLDNNPATATSSMCKPGAEEVWIFRCLTFEHLDQLCFTSLHLRIRRLKRTACNALLIASEIYMADDLG